MELLRGDSKSLKNINLFTRVKWAPTHRNYEFAGLQSEKKKITFHNDLELYDSKWKGGPLNVTFSWHRFSSKVSVFFRKKFALFLGKKVRLFWSKYFSQTQNHDLRCDIFFIKNRWFFWSKELVFWQKLIQKSSFFRKNNRDVSKSPPKMLFSQMQIWFLKIRSFGPCITFGKNKFTQNTIFFTDVKFSYTFDSTSIDFFHPKTPFFDRKIDFIPKPPTRM